MEKIFMKKYLSKYSFIKIICLKLYEKMKNN